MQLKHASIALVIGLLITVTTGSGCTRAAAAEPKAANNPVDLTVYKQDFGLVHERRKVSLSPGSNDITIGGVSNMLDADSVIFESPKGARVVSTTYELGAGSNEGLIQRLAGKEVEFIWDSNDGREGSKMTGRLEPTSEGGFLLRVGERVYINPKGTLIAPSDVSTLPGLAARIESDAASNQELGVSYLTRGLSWNADYVAYLNTDAGTMSVECWASIQNRTGVPFKDARVTFVAGSPNRDADFSRPYSAVANSRGRLAAEDSTITVGSLPKMKVESVGELYQYKSKDRANIGVDQLNRVRMFDAVDIPVKLDYSIRLPYIDGWGSQAGHRQNAQLAINVTNSKKVGLGVPMPAGAVRIYQNDGSENRYTGADTLSDLAVDSRASLTLSGVFDVTGEPSVVKNERINRRTVRKTLRVVLRNAKPKEVEVRLVQELYGRFTIAEGPKPQKLDASTLQWKVLVPANGKKTFEVKLDIGG